MAISASYSSLIVHSKFSMPYMVGYCWGNWTNHVAFAWLDDPTAWCLSWSGDRVSTTSPADLCISCCLRLYMQNLLFLAGNINNQNFLKPTEVNNRWMWATDGGGVADAFTHKSKYNIFILIYSAIKACKIFLISVQGQFPFYWSRWISFTYSPPSWNRLL